MQSKFLFHLILLSSFVIALSGCDRKNKTKQSEGNNVYSQKNYSELIVDSLYFDSVLLSEKTDEAFKADIRDFYRRRNYQTAWFSNHQLTENGVNFIYRIDEYKEAFEDSSILDKKSHNLITNAIMDSTYKFKDKVIIDGLDIRLTIAFFKYASKAYYGIDDSDFDLEWFIPRKKKNYEMLLEKVTSSNSDFEKYEPVNKYYRSLKSALLQYRKIERSNGLPHIYVLPENYPTEDSTALYSALANYLKSTQDWALNSDSIVTIETFKNSISNFQDRMGIAMSGKLDAETVTAMNVPIKDRIFQMMVNLERLRWIPEQLSASYLLVNIPEYKLHVFEDNKLNFSMNVVVGRSVTATTIFNENLSTIVFSPYWNIPQSIIANELLPKLKKDRHYLNKKNMEVVKNNEVVNSSKINWDLYTKGVPFVIREKPGKQNSLGLVKFLFPNSYSIYMHDTPSKGLFEKESRAFSHGCIRLAEPLKLASYLLKSDTNITQDMMIKWMNAGKEKYVKVKPVMPVFIVYFTSWVNHKGQLNFRKDIYGLDKKLSHEIFELHQ